MEIKRIRNFLNGTGLAAMVALGSVHCAHHPSGMSMLYKDNTMYAIQTIHRNLSFCEATTERLECRNIPLPRTHPGGVGTSGTYQITDYLSLSVAWKEVMQITYNEFAQWIELKLTNGETKIVGRTEYPYETIDAMEGLRLHHLGRY